MKDTLLAVVIAVLTLSLMYQNSVVVQQRGLIRQMTTNPFCLMPKEAR